MIHRVRRRPTAALFISYSILFFFLLCCTCHATSHDADVGGPCGLMKDAGVNDAIGGIDESNDSAIQAITSQLSSWMNEKRKRNAKSKKQNIGEDLPLEQNDQPLKPKQGLPFVTLAYAQTLDGMIAAKCPTRRETHATTSNMKLSSSQSMVLTHRLRSMHDAILVGGSTFLLDAPRLNVRLAPPSTAFGSSNVAAQNNAILEQPMPVVLDTHLNYLQLLLFDKIVTSRSKPQSPKDKTLPDITIDKVNAHNPIICCSPNATQSFLDVLEVFRDQQAYAKRKRKKSYKITVYKKIDDEGDHEQDFYLPIKITVRVITHHSRKQEEDVCREVTLTLLPCPIDETRTNPQLDVRQMLHQLHNQFGIESVMVEGGSGILSSFMNGCMEESVGCNEGGGSSNRSSCGKAADCICATIVPKLIGGRWGLPVLGGLDVLPDNLHEIHSTKVADSDDDDDDDGRGEVPEIMAAKDGTFVPLGPDCIFLGRI